MHVSNSLSRSILTYSQELAVWRKQATISVQEEFAGKTLSPTLEDSLPQNLQETFDTVRSGVRRSAELYINLCSLVERLCKRKEAIAGEYGRLTLNLNSITETTNDTYAIDQNDVELLNEGIRGTAKHIGTSQALLEDEARAWDEGFLEDLKTMRDALVSMRDMFDRRDRYAKDNIPQLEKRIQQNEQKLQNIQAKGDAAKAGEADKVANAITAVRSPSCRRAKRATDCCSRTNKPSSTSMPGASSSKSAFAMSCSSSRVHSTACPGYTRTGRRSE